MPHLAFFVVIELNESQRVFYVDVGKRQNKLYSETTAGEKKGGACYHNSDIRLSRQIPLFWSEVSPSTFHGGMMRRTPLNADRILS